MMCLHDTKNNRSEHLVSQWTDTIQYTVDLNECGIKNLWINLVSTRHLRPWYAKRKKSVDDSSQKIGRNRYLQGTATYTNLA